MWQPSNHSFWSPSWCFKFNLHRATFIKYLKANLISSLLTTRSSLNFLIWSTNLPWFGWSLTITSQASNSIFMLCDPTTPNCYKQFPSFTVLLTSVSSQSVLSAQNTISRFSLPQCLVNLIRSSILLMSLHLLIYLSNK